jgi:hypothetical protein
MRSSLCPLAAVMLTCTSALADLGFEGIVNDSGGLPVAQAEVTIGQSGGAVVFSTTTNAQGKFLWPDAPHGSFHLRVIGAGFATRQTRVLFHDNAPEVQITLQPASIYNQMTINASRGALEEAMLSPHVANR